MIEKEHADGVTILRLAHGKASALDVELLAALDSELAALANSENALVLTGTGSIFSAGVDLFRLLHEDSNYLARFIPLLNSMLERLFTFPRPVVVAANGHAIAGGCILVQCADYRLMSEGTGRIGVPELLVGVPFPSMPMQILQFAIPRHHLQKIVYTGVTLLPGDALAHGLIDEITSAELLLSRAVEIASSMAAIPRQTFRLTKNQLRGRILERSSSVVNADEEIDQIWGSPESAEHIKQYLQRTVKSAR